jgi:arylsulfatase A-like enzyme
MMFSMPNSIVLRLLFCVACLVLWGGRSANATNVVFIMADDLGVMDVGFNNPGTFYETPRLDALAKESVRFTAGYAACPVCSPTRSSILTGQYPARTRYTDYFGGPNGFDAMPESYDPMRDGQFGRFANRPVLPAPYVARLAHEHTTLAEALKAAGYATMHAGKWHLGGEGSLPTDHGFDVNVAGASGGAPLGGRKYFSPYGNPYLPDGPPGEHLPDRLATEVSKFITAHKDEQFFVYLPFYSVHTPLMAPEHLVAKYEAKRKRLGLEPRFEAEPPRENRIIQEHAVYAGMVEAMDSAVGKVLDALDANGVADDTLVIFFSDNGGLSTSEGSPTSNLPYRAGKGWLYEGGIREPLIVRWPGKGKAGAVCDVPVTSTDFYPTILDVCGLEPIPGQHVDGVSFADLLEDPTAKHDRPPLFWHYPHWGNQGGIPSSAVRDGDWKLITFAWKKPPELYHLADDLGERQNLAAERPEKLAELQAILDDSLRRTGAVQPSENPNAKTHFETW